jgi:hypothetical protein
MIEIRKYVWGEEEDVEDGYALSNTKARWWCYVAIRDSKVYGRGIIVSDRNNDAWIIKDHQLPRIAKYGFIQNIFEKKK